MGDFIDHLRTRYLDNLRSEVFDKNWARVNEENRSGIILILFFIFLIILVNLIVLAIMGLSVTAQLVQLGAYLILTWVVRQFALKRPKARYTLWIYLIEVPMLLMSMVVGTVFETDRMAFTFMLILLVFPPLILDKPKRISTFILANAVAFGVLGYLTKEPQAFSRDLLHLFNACLISMMAATYYTSTRMENIRHAGYYAHKAVRDPLTGLYNRDGAEENIDASQPGALIYLDLDNFKQINDTFGHPQGDRALKKTAHALRRSFRDEDVVIRLGGDEFAVYAKGAWTEDAIARRLSQTLESLKEIRVTSDGKGDVAVLASAGCVIAPHGCESLEQMIKLADEQMYLVKDSGKGGYRIALLS